MTKWTVQDIVSFLQTPSIPRKIILIRACELRKELEQLIESLNNECCKDTIRDEILESEQKP